MLGETVRWREIAGEDLRACFQAHTMSLGDSIVGWERALEVWQNLLMNPAFVGRVVETGSGEGRIIALGASVFVAPEFLCEELAGPRLGLSSRIIAKLAAGERVLLDQRQIARANAGPGLDVVFISLVWWQTTSQGEFSQLMMASIGSCVEAHAGYRVRSASMECPGEMQRTMGMHSGQFEIVAEFPEADVVWMRITGEGASVAAASASNLMFQYRQPVVGFTASEQQLLQAAIRGALDRELADVLGITVSVVKKRWRGVFARVHECLPELFAEAGGEDESARGPQKRHLVLSYVRAHPEELRPYEWEV
jgi:hypothetical protein